jgi:pyruvate dehydrogenase E1 component alpha subunit
VVEDGQDAIAVGDAMQRLIAATRIDRKPRFIEIHTYRYKEHVGPGEDYEAGYRSRSELRAWQAKDVLMQDAELVARFKPSIDREIAAAVAFAEDSRAPGREELLTDIL